MKRFHLLRFTVVAIACVIVALACSKGPDSPVSPDGSDQSKTALGGVISLGTALDEGSEIVVPVEFAEASDLYAMSFRVGFDPAGLELVEIEWGDVVTEEDATFHMKGQRGFVPVGFARYSGMPGLEGHGTLCRLRFRVLDPALGDPWIIRNREYLVAKNSIGIPMRLEVGGDAR